MSTRPSTPASRCLHPKGRKLAIGSWKLPGVEIHDLDTGEAMTLSHPRGVRGLAWRDDGKLLATACDIWVYVWDVANPRQPLQVLRGHQGVTIRVAFNHGGDLLASESWDGTTRLWDGFTGKQMVSTPYSGAGYRFPQSSPN